MIIKNQAAHRTATEKPKGGAGVINAVGFVTAGNRPDHTKFSLGSLNTLPPGAGVGNHAHEGNEEAYFILEGDGVYIDSDGQEYPVAKGDFTLCREGESHGLFNKSSAPLVFAAVIVDGGQ